jgi:hypothetical protein
MEREKGRERITTSCEYKRESCPKVVKKWLSKYHFSFNSANKMLLETLSGGPNLPIFDVHWTSPDNGCYKLNVDAAGPIEGG